MLFVFDREQNEVFELTNRFNISISARSQSQRKQQYL
jgi:hypothetical protein